ncbi:tetratricopeptide repeat protein [Xanthobacter sp. V4C-4]|uniref:tetratricopeptide repeat protein n=1 Tax=Xanthobacter cornucopiae TaxID=3119924 RepID=UPI003727B79C
MVTGAMLVAGLLIHLSSAAATPTRQGEASGVAPIGSDAPPSPRKAPRDKRAQLEGLFAALKVAPDDRSAKIIGDRLDQLFNTTDSSSVDLLMARATVALEAKQVELALKILGQALEIDPDDIGALSKRATIYYMRDDYGPALADIREVLAREPRHYGMLYGLALIFRDIGDDKRALEATRKALVVNPRLEGAKELEAQLTLTVEGRGI